MTALRIDPVEPICPLDPPGCRRPLAAVPPHDHSAESGAPRAPAGPSRPPGGGGLDLSPVSAYEIVTRQMIEATQRDVAEIKGRINNLMVMVCGAVLVNIVLRMAGLG